MKETMTKLKNTVHAALFGNKSHSRLVLILVLSIMVLGILRPQRFLTIYSFQSMAAQFPQFGLLALGVMLAMISGGIDLSVVGVANLSSVLAAKTMLALVSPESVGFELFFGILCVILMALLIGALAGFLNGFLISHIGVPPILATLATMQLFRGITIVITAGRAVSGLPTQFSNYGNANVLGIIPAPLVVFIIAALFLSILLNRTVFGEHVFMVGTNQRAAVFSGLNTKHIIIRTYIISGTMAALAGLVMMARMNSARADYGTQYTLQSILVVVLGGVDPYGGTGKVSNVVLAILVLQVLSTGLNMFPAISNFYRSFIWGAVLILVLALNTIQNRGFLAKSK